MSDLRPTRSSAAPANHGRSTGPAPVEERHVDRRSAPLSPDTQIAVEIRSLVAAGGPDDLAQARERFAELVATHQRRALRIAYQYLRDPGEADEAVQDAFVKVFSHIGSYREAWPFEVWFTRILINGCLDRRKTRQRRDRWFAQSGSGLSGSAAIDAVANHDSRSAFGTPPAADPESLLLSRERRAHLAAAIDRLDGRQRTVFMLTHFGDCTPREVSAITGLNESTVRVHLFRAARKLRGLLGGKAR